MIKEKLMEALKMAAADYNGGMGASESVAKAAEANDFNEHQSERLVEMFNTLAALNKEKDAGDATGACELADKKTVSKLLMGSCGSEKTASAPRRAGADWYGFYASSPSKTNPTIEARRSGAESLMKQASSGDAVPEELNLSRGSLYKVIRSKIDVLKEASAAADEVVRNLRLEIEGQAIKVAKAIEYSPAADIADMFKAACDMSGAVSTISEYSEKVAASKGGVYMNRVFDSSPIDELLKIASDMESNIGLIPEYEKKRDMFATKAAEAEDRMMEIAGLSRVEHKDTLADFFSGDAMKKIASPGKSGSDDDSVAEVGLGAKIAELIRLSGIEDEGVQKLAEDLEKDAAPIPAVIPAVSFSTGDAIDALSKGKGIGGVKQKILNVLRETILQDLLVNDPVIRDANPNDVLEAYKTMIMSSPRVSLDKAQVRSFIRSAINSVAVSPADAKVLTDVDKGMALANVEKLTSIDSSIKDSNRA